MKFSSISTIGGLFALTSAQIYTETIPVVCTGAPASTVTQTVTVTAGTPPYPTNPGGPNQPVKSSYVTTVGGTVTSVDYDGGSKSSVWVYPTGTGSKHCTVATYENDIVINVIIVDINIIINNGVTSTVTVTQSGSSVTSTPIPPPVTHTGTTTSSAPYSTGTGTSHFKVHDVTVGARGMNIYDPPQFDAAVGDVVRFTFLAKNHTVTQSDFLTPCTFDGGFDTGFNQFNPTNATNIVRNFTVTTTKPTWFHCAQTVPNMKSHCQDGMVLGINPAGKFDAFRDLATKSGNTTSTTSTAAGTGSLSTSIPLSTATAYPYKYPTVKGRSFNA